MCHFEMNKKETERKKLQEFQQNNVDLLTPLSLISTVFFIKAKKDCFSCLVIAFAYDSKWNTVEIFFFHTSH